MRTIVLSVAALLFGVNVLVACSSGGGGEQPELGGPLATAGASGSGGAGGSAGPSGGGTSPGGALVGTGGSSPIGNGGTPGSAGTFGGTGGTPSSGGGGGTGGGMQGDKPPCLKDASQIILMGDSYVNWVSHTFPTDINDASMLSIEDFAIGATSMGSGGIGLIAPQFETALASHPSIITVILDGGGNDVLVPDPMFPQGGQCKMNGAQSPSIPDCQKIVQKALDAGRQLFLHMADKGVKDAVFFFYPHVPLGTPIGGTDPNGMLDYALPKIQAECDGAYQNSILQNPQKPIRCHFVNMVPVFAGHTDYFSPGDIHPSPAGSKAMAAAVWAKMKQDCVAQPASSGCCTPQ